MREIGLRITMLGTALCFATMVFAEPFDQNDLARAFELSKTCSDECSNESVHMVRIPFPKGKSGFLIVTNDQDFCGSGGCSSVIVVVSGNHFEKIIDGLGITKSQAISFAANDRGINLAGPPSGGSKIVYPNAISSIYSQEPVGRARMLTCRDQYNANKTSDANGGLQWTTDSGGYYSICNERLKASACARPPFNRRYASE